MTHFLVHIFQVGMAFFDEFVHGGEKMLVDVFDSIIELLSKGGVCLVQRNYFMLYVRMNLVHAMSTKWFLITNAVEGNYVVML
jgi:hypothetical protein